MVYEDWISQTVQNALELASRRAAAGDFEAALQALDIATRLAPTNGDLGRIINSIRSLRGEAGEFSSVDVTASSTEPVASEKVADPPDPERREIPGSTETLEQRFRVARENWALGIDFGTSNIRIALCEHMSDGTQRIDTLRIGDAASLYPNLMPSVVAFNVSDESVSPIVGERALDYEGDRAWRLVRHIKRRLVVEFEPENTSIPYPAVEFIRRQFDWIDSLPGSPTPEQVGRLIVGEALKRAQRVVDRLADERGEDPLDLMRLSIRFGVWAPAGFGTRKSMVNMFRAVLPPGAELELSHLSVEPGLAAESLLRYESLLTNQDQATPGRHVIFDFGGGTFDVAVIEITSDSRAVLLASDGEPLVGASDIERSIERFVLESVVSESGTDLETLHALVDDDQAARAALTSAITESIERNKQGLDIRVSLEDFLGSGDRELEIDDLQFEQIITESSAFILGASEPRNVLDAVVDATKRCIARAYNAQLPLRSVPVSSFDAIRDSRFIESILLVGGGSLFEAVEAHVRKTFTPISVRTDTDIRSNIHPLFAIVTGAAYQANSGNHDWVIDRPDVGIYVTCDGQATPALVYEPYSTTYTHRTVSSHPAILPRKFSVPETHCDKGLKLFAIGPLESKSSEIIRQSDFADSYCVFRRWGEFEIVGRGGMTLFTYRLPTATSWQAQLRSDHQAQLRENEANKQAQLDAGLADDPTFGGSGIKPL